MTHDKLTEDLGPRVRRVAPATTLAAGTAVGAWRIEELIAAGGGGAVYRARHAVLGRHAAVKVLHPELAGDPAVVARFVLEAQAVNRIEHPNIVDVFDFGALGDRPYLVMELLAADNLEDRLIAEGPRSAAECLAILGPVCRAVEAAHRAGFIHRDLKARNIGFAIEADGRETVRVLDFGIAKLVAPDGGDGSTATIRLGTPHCIAPEQIRGQRVDARTDVYALGVLLYHLVTGVYPFDADDSLEVERLHLDAPPPRPSRLVPAMAAIDDLVIAAMAKDRHARPPSALAFLEQLERALGDGIAAARRPAIALQLTISAADDRDPSSGAVADAIDAAIERLVPLLTGAGLEVLLAAGPTVLAARPLDADPRATLDRVRAVAQAATRAVAERSMPALLVRCAIHASEL